MLVGRERACCRGERDERKAYEESRHGGCSHRHSQRISRRTAVRKLPLASSRVVSRRFSFGAFAALCLVSTAAAQPKLLMPGVTYDTRVDFTFHGPVVLHVLTMPRPGGLWALKPVLSNDAILGTEKVTAIEQRVSPLATVAGVNGDRFASNGRPSGILIRNGALDQGPSDARSSIGLDATGALRVEKVRLLATWQGTGQRQTLTAVNNSPSSSGTSLYTPAWGPATPAAPGSVEVVLEPFPPATPNVEVSGRVVSVGGGGGTPIPADGAVLVARGAAATNRVRAEAPAGSTVHVRLILQPDWAGVTDALGGGPALVRRGKAIFDANEAFVANQLAVPEPRTAVGQLKDGRIVLVAADGRQPGYSTGMTNFELALALVKLGVVTGAALDGGGSTAMAFDGRLLNKPSDKRGERAVSRSAVDRLLRHPGARSGCLRALAERRRGRRDPAARVQGRAALDRQRRADRPGRSRTAIVHGAGCARDVPALVERPDRRGDGRDRGNLAVVAECHRRPRASVVVRARLHAERHARLRKGGTAVPLRATSQCPGCRAGDAHARRRR